MEYNGFSIHSFAVLFIYEYFNRRSVILVFCVSLPFSVVKRRYRHCHAPSGVALSFIFWHSVLSNYKETCKRFSPIQCYAISGRHHQLIPYPVYDIQNGFCLYSISHIHRLDYCIYYVRIMHSDVVEDIERKAFSIQREKLEGVEKFLPFKCGK